MSSRANRLAALLAASALLLGCDATGPGIGFNNTGVLGGGYSGMGNQSFDFFLADQFRYMFGSGDANCEQNGQCGVAGVTQQVGLMANGGERLIFVATADAVQNGAVIPVVASGVQTVDLSITDPAQYQALRLVLDWAFLTSHPDGASNNDSAVVRVKAGNDSAVVFRVTRADLLAGRVPVRGGGCGEHAFFPDRPIDYRLCSDWQTTVIDLSAWRSRPSFVLQFAVGEGGPNPGTDRPAAFLFRRSVIEGGT